MYDMNLSTIKGETEIHLVMDNYSTHKHQAVKRELADHPRYQIHYIPTYASWVNQVEIWFNVIKQKAIRRGTFKSVKELTAKIDHFVEQYNTDSRAFVWTSTADSILEKIQRLYHYISETRHEEVVGEGAYCTSGS
jgi:putative transposase